MSQPLLPAQSELRATQSSNAIRRALLKALSLLESGAVAEARAAIVASITDQAQASNELRNALTALYQMVAAGPAELPVAPSTWSSAEVAYHHGIAVGQFELASFAREVLASMRVGVTAAAVVRKDPALAPTPLPAPAPAPALVATPATATPRPRTVSVDIDLGDPSIFVPIGGRTQFDDLGIEELMPLPRS